MEAVTADQTQLEILADRTKHKLQRRDNTKLIKCIIVCNCMEKETRMNICKDNRITQGGASWLQLIIPLINTKQQDNKQKWLEQRQE